MKLYSSAASRWQFGFLNAKSEYWIFTDWDDLEMTHGCFIGRCFQGFFIICFFWLVHKVQKLFQCSNGWNRISADLKPTNCFKLNFKRVFIAWLVKSEGSEIYFKTLNVLINCSYSSIFEWWSKVQLCFKLKGKFCLSKSHWSSSSLYCFISKKRKHSRKILKTREF